MRVTVLALLALPLAGPAFAQATNSIPWFVANPEARAATLRACRDDWRLHATPEGAAICANAETAETRVYARRLGGAFRTLDTPAYWNRNPGMMAALRAACARRASYDAPLLRYCHLADRDG